MPGSGACCQQQTHCLSQHREVGSRATLDTPQRAPCCADWRACPAAVSAPPTPAPPPLLHTALGPSYPPMLTLLSPPLLPLTPFPASPSPSCLPASCLPAPQTFAEKLAKLNAAEGVTMTPADFSLNFLWLDKNIAVAVDQVFNQVGARCWAGWACRWVAAACMGGWCVLE